MVKAVDAVEHAGLAGAVGADDGEYLSFANIEAHVRQRLDAAEGQAYISHFHRHFSCFIHAFETPLR